jgi:hypothetical protein
MLLEVDMGAMFSFLEARIRLKLASLKRRLDEVLLRFYKGWRLDLLADLETDLWLSCLFLDPDYK